MSAWCEPGQHTMHDREMELLRWERQPTGAEIPVYACRACVRAQGLVPRRATGAAFIGHRDTPPSPPRKST